MVMKRRPRSARPQDRKTIDLRRGVFLLPNLLTTGGLLCGFYSVIASMRGDFVIAALAIIAANVFDVLDGRVARVTRSTSAFGMQYDSLSDLVAFGVAPGILVYRWALEPWGTVGWLAASLYVTCGALRLARFNVQFQPAQKRHFVGLPIPAAAEVIALTVLLYFHVFASMHTSFRHLVVLVMVYALAGLMVSNVRYFSFKEIDLHRRQPFWVLIASIILLKILIAEPQIFLFTGIALYTLSGPLQWLVSRQRRWLVSGESDLTGEEESSSLRVS
jgi:CDP-diacylglycerol--serine O-phosphatidyltransferase